MACRVVHSLQETEWRRFVEEHPQGNVFHTPEMFRVFESAKGQQPTLWAAIDHHNRPQALLLPVQVTLAKGWLRRLTSRAVAYGSILCAPRQEGIEALRPLLETYNRATRGRILFTELRNLSNLSDMQPVLNDCGFNYEDHLNYLVDLTRTPEEIWKSIRSNARRNVRRARKAQVAIKEVRDMQQIAGAYLLLKEIYQRIQVPLADFSFFQAAFEILHPRDMMRIFLARLDGVDMGVMTLLLYKDTMIYWYSGTLRSMLPTGPVICSSGTPWNGATRTGSASSTLAALASPAKNMACVISRPSSAASW